MPDMGLAVPVVWSAACVEHGAEQRAAVIRAAVMAAGAAMVQATPHPDDAVLAVHERELVDYLRTAHEALREFPPAPASEPTTIAPHVFPTPAMLGAVPPGEPGSVRALAGRFCYDTATPVRAGTWEAARGAVDAALTAVDLLLKGEPLSYALTQLPGHHATRAGYGGGCYLNHAAVAAQAMRRAGARRVAVVDLDAHHGNGTQAVFWDTAEVLYVSVHVDPAAGWFPHYVGHATESGGGRGGGATVNLPLPPGTRDEGWLAAVATAVTAVREQEPDAIVVSLGVGAARVDPGSPLSVSRQAFRLAGRRLAALGVPVAVVQEGVGDHPAAAADHVVAALEGLAERP